jgi:hypothetical protein
LFILRKEEMRTWAFGTGLAVVVGTHVYMLNNSLPDALKQQHALLNLGAAGLIVWSVSGYTS